MVWYLLIGLSFGTGLLRLPRWTVVVWPAVSVALGVHVVAAELPKYDVLGFGQNVGVVIAVACLVGWLLGRGLAALAHRLAANRTQLH